MLFYPLELLTLLVLYCLQSWRGYIPPQIELDGLLD